MGILTRFKDIISANINDLLDKAEDPGKMIDQYLREMMEDLAEVKKETAGVMAEESRTKRLVDENATEVAKYTALAKKALQAGNEGDARTFLSKKQQLEEVGASLETAYAAAHDSAIKMRQLHDKLTSDINALNNRKQAIKAKVAVAKTQEKVNQLGLSASQGQAAISAFDRMEAKADRMLDEANARAELDAAPVDAAAALEAKYQDELASASVEAELAKMKADLGL